MPKHPTKPGWFYPNYKGGYDKYIKSPRDEGPPAELVRAIIRHFREKNLQRIIREGSNGRTKLIKNSCHNWFTAGRFPLHYTLEIASILGCSPYALNRNYDKLMGFQEEKPDWENIVRSCWFLRKEVMIELIAMKR